MGGPARAVHARVLLRFPRPVITHYNHSLGPLGQGRGPSGQWSGVHVCCSGQSSSGQSSIPPPTPSAPAPGSPGLCLWPQGLAGCFWGPGAGGREFWAPLTGPWASIPSPRTGWPTGVPPLSLDLSSGGGLSGTRLPAPVRAEKNHGSSSSTLPISSPLSFFLHSSCSVASLQRVLRLGFQSFIQCLTSPPEDHRSPPYCALGSPVLASTRSFCKPPPPSLNLPVSLPNSPYALSLLRGFVAPPPFPIIDFNTLARSPHKIQKPPQKTPSPSRPWTIPASMETTRRPSTAPQRTRTAHTVVRPSLLPP